MSEIEQDLRRRYSDVHARLWTGKTLPPRADASLGINENGPLTDKDGEVRELTVDDFKKFRPIAEVDPGMLEAVRESPPFLAVAEAVYLAAHPGCAMPDETRLRDMLARSSVKPIVALRRTAMAILSEVCGVHNRAIGDWFRRASATVSDSLAAYEERIEAARRVLPADATYGDWARELLRYDEIGQAVPNEEALVPTQKDHKMASREVTLENAKSGDVVQLKSGGAGMTLSRSPELAPDLVLCQWMTANGKLKSAYFESAMLIFAGIVNEEPTS